MSDRFIECMDECFEKWTPRQKFTMYKIEPKQKLENVGII